MAARTAAASTVKGSKPAAHQVAPASNQAAGSSRLAGGTGDHHVVGVAGEPVLLDHREHLGQLVRLVDLHREQALVAGRPAQRAGLPWRAPTQIGMRGCWTAGGACGRPRPRSARRGAARGSPDHRSTSTSRASSSIRPRVFGSSSSPKAVSSPPGSPPMPTPRTNRPADRRSSDRVSRASFWGRRRGSGRDHRADADPLGGHRDRGQRDPRVGDVGDRRPVQHVVPDEHAVPAGRLRLGGQIGHHARLGQLPEDGQEDRGRASRRPYDTLTG